MTRGAYGNVSGIIFTPTTLFAQEDTPTPTVPVLVQPGTTCRTSNKRSQAACRSWVPRAHPGETIIRRSYDGIDFLGSNCHCLPPDTNAAVGNGFVVETVNVQIRIFDTGNILLNEPFAKFFGAFSGGDPYVVYDDTANRWYVSAFDSTDRGVSRTERAQCSALIAPYGSAKCVNPDSRQDSRG